MKQVLNEDTRKVLGRMATTTTTAATGFGTTRQYSRASPDKRGIMRLCKAFNEAASSVDDSELHGSRATHGSKSIYRSTHGTSATGIKGFARTMLYKLLPETQKKGMRIAQMRASFVQEMRTLNKLRHPCICQIVGAVLVPGVPAMMVMEHMGLGSLHGLLHNGTMQLEGDVVFNFIMDLISGMRFLHAADPPIAHADLKSHNALVDEKWRLKICDKCNTPSSCISLSLFVCLLCIS